MESKRKNTIPQPPEHVYSFINGKQETASTGELIQVINPADERIVTALVEADELEVEKAVTTARTSFEQGSWSRANTAQRQKVLLHIAELLYEHAEEIAAMDTLCVGLCYHAATLPQTYAAADWFQYFAGLIETRQDALFQQLPDMKTMVSREPVGVVGLFSPWNIPVMSASLKLSAALACGNSCVLKPSEQSPWGTLKLVQLMHEAGLPTGVVNVVNGRGALTGAALCKHADVGAVSFTGGGRVGSEVAAAASRRFAKVTMELGGKSANIIFADADMERALDAALLSLFSNNGQACLAGSRILLQQDIADDFISEFVHRTERIRIGDPFAADTELGPQSSKAQMDRVLSYVDVVIEEGGEILSGGGHADGFENGYYIKPIIARARHNKTRVCQEEIFGPFATFLSFNTEEEAIAMANDTRFGLTAYVWTENLQRALGVAERLRSGYVLINSPMQREKNAPFGGFNHSGLGREGGMYSMNFFTEAKAILLPFAGSAVNKLGA